MKLKFTKTKNVNRAFSSNAINCKQNECSRIDSRLPSYFSDIFPYIMYA